MVDYLTFKDEISDGGTEIWKWEKKLDLLFTWCSALAAVTTKAPSLAVETAWLTMASYCASILYQHLRLPLIKTLDIIEIPFTVVASYLSTYASISKIRKHMHFHFHYTRYPWTNTAATIRDASPSQRYQRVRAEPSANRDPHYHRTNRRGPLDGGNRSDFALLLSLQKIKNYPQHLYHFGIHRQRWREYRVNDRIWWFGQRRGINSLPGTRLHLWVVSCRFCYHGVQKPDE